MSESEDSGSAWSRRRRACRRRWSTRCWRWPRGSIPDRTPEIVFHPQCFASHGHFAGDDDTRARAFLEVANDDSYDAVWFARGGYGSCRVAEAVIGGLTQAARRKTYLGYSDAGALLAALYRAGFADVAHGPVAQDILRDGGDAAVGRALAWMIDRAPAALEPTVNGATQDRGVQHHDPQPVARHAAAARPRRACADAGGGERGDVPDRPRAVSHHQQRRDPAGRGHHARPLQRHHPERSGFRDERGGGRAPLVPRDRGFHGWVAPTSGTTSTTRSCRSGPVRPARPRESGDPGHQKTLDFRLRGNERWSAAPNAPVT